MKEKAWKYWIIGAVVFLASAALVAGVWFATEPGDTPFRRFLGRFLGISWEETVRTTAEESFPETEMETEPTKPPVPVEELTLLETSLTMEKDAVAELIFEVAPADADLSGLRFESDNEDVVRVDSDGLLTAVGAGEARVKVIAGKCEAECLVTVTGPLTAIRFETEEIVLGKDSKLRLALLTEPAKPTEVPKATFESMNEKVAKVDENGILTTVGNGETEIRATIGSLEAVCHVTVRTRLKGIGFSFSALNVRLGDTVRLPLIYNPADTTDDKTTEWTSSNPAVVTVSADGTIRAAGAGSAVIQAKTGKFSAQARINVIIPVNGVAISQTSMVLNKGTSAKLTASVLPANTTESKYVTFSSDNVNVARVDAAGVITAVSPGTARITANHDLVGSVCEVTVLSPLQSISFHQETLSLIETFSGELTVHYEPEDTTDPKTVSFRSESPEIASVDENGVVTAHAVGTCQIIAETQGKTAVSVVTVLPFIEVERVEITPTEYLFSRRGETFQITAAVYPEDATQDTVSFTSSNPDVARVDGNGLVRAVDRGTAVITVSAGAQSAVCQVTVDIPDPDKIVVLDPGHSGRFSGASYFGRDEEDINLMTALACKNYLETHYAGVKVYLTRSDDSPLANDLNADLEARAQYAQDMGADILVSLHYNASNQHTASGCLCFVSSQPNVAEVCRALAVQILAQLETTGLQNRGPVSTVSNQYFDEFGNPLDYYAINRHSANRGIPGIIVEHCFMDRDADYIDTDEEVAHFGVLDAIGIANYLGLSAK